MRSPRYSGWAALRQSIVLEFIACIGGQLAQLREAQEMGCVEDAANHVHALRGGAGTAGAAEIAARACAIETLIRAGYDNDLGPVVDELVAGVTDLRRQVLVAVSGAVTER